MVIALAMSMMAGAFASDHFGITSPTAPEGERALVAPGEDVLLEAIGPDTGGVQWAVRAGTCAKNEGAIAGNVDGYNDEAYWEGGEFSYTLSHERLSPTVDDEFYCFVFNPREGGDETRYTQEFVVVSEETTKDICKDGGWRDWADPSFKNQGECVRYFEAHPNAAFDTFDG